MNRSRSLLSLAVVFLVGLQPACAWFKQNSPSHDELLLLEVDDSPDEHNPRRGVASLQRGARDDDATMDMFNGLRLRQADSSTQEAMLDHMQRTFVCRIGARETHRVEQGHVVCGHGVV